MTPEISEGGLEVGGLREILQEDYLKESTLLNLLPVAVYVCDANGFIKKYNDHAVRLWGRIPVSGDKDERFCGAWRLYYPNGIRLPHNETPVAACLSDGMPRKNIEVVIERPDHSRITVNVNIVPIVDSEGRITGVINSFHDITEKKETERLLQQKCLELEDHVENATIPLHWVDANGIIVFANQAELDLLGYSREEYIGHHISEFYVHKHAIDDILNRLNLNETILRYESQMRCKDGTIKTVHINSNVQREEGRFVHTRCFTIDISKEKDLVDALLKSEERYRHLVQALPAAVYTTDIEGRISLFNQAAAELWGREPVIGKDLWCGSWKIYEPNGTIMPLDTCPMAIALKEVRTVYGHEIIIERPDGTRRHVLPYPRPLFDGNGKPYGAVNMLIDITALKEAERKLRTNEVRLRELTISLEKKVQERTADLQNTVEELRQSEERYHKMVEEVEDYAILLLNKDGHIQNWNRGAERIKGYREGEVIGKHVRIFYPPEDREKKLPEQLIDQAIRYGKSLHEGWRIRKNGSRIWASVVLTALHDSENNIIGLTKVTRDLTEKKLVEEKIKQYNLDLEFQNRELEQFAYAAAHDMKEPLRKIRFYNNLIAETAGEQLPPKEKGYLDRSIAAATRMQNLIDDLLTYSKVSPKTYEENPVNLNECLQEVLQIHHEVIQETSAVIEADPLPVIYGVPFQMIQLLDNLVGNALKYRHPERQPRIRITAAIKNSLEILGSMLDEQVQYHVISISDNGIGFDARYTDTIFDLFQRLHDKMSYSGTGIGLAICRKVAQNHKGHITAKGEPGNGAEFTIYLPVKTAT